MGEGLSARPSLVLGTKVLGWRACKPRWAMRRRILAGAQVTPRSERSSAEAAVAVASAVAPEDGLDQVAKAGVGDLRRGGCGGVVEAAAGLAEHGTDLADAAAGFLGDELDHRAAPGWGLVPRMTAAFFKMSFSSLRLAISRE